MSAIIAPSAGCDNIGYGVAATFRPAHQVLGGAFARVSLLGAFRWRHGCTTPIA